MKALVADSLKRDERVAKAKQLLKEALDEHKATLTGVRPADPDRALSYEETIKAFGEARGGGLYYPYLGSGIGNGALVELADGSVKYDFICGIGVHFWGHNHPDLLEPSIDAALTDVVMQGHLQQNREQYELTQMLLAASGCMDHCFLTSSGAMANENALKIIFQHRFPANRVLAFSHCFTGRTLAISQITDKPLYREGLPATLAVDYVPFYDHQDPEGSTQRAVHALKEHLNRYPKQHAVFVMELVQGEGGFYPGTHDFFMALMRILKEHGIATLVDEVQSFGRTPSLFAYQHFGLEDYVDVVTVGKLSQVCATLYKAPFKPRPGLLSQTFTTSTSALYAARVIIGGLINGNYLGENGRLNEIQMRFRERFEAIAARHPGSISGPHGIGAMVAFQPFDGTFEQAKSTARALYDHGVLSFIAGSNPSRVRFLVPAGAATNEDIDAVCEIVEQTLVEQSSLCNVK